MASIATREKRATIQACCRGRTAGADWRSYIRRLREVRAAGIGGCSSGREREQAVPEAASLPLKCLMHNERLHIQSILYNPVDLMLY